MRLESQYRKSAFSCVFVFAVLLSGCGGGNGSGNPIGGGTQPPTVKSVTVILAPTSQSVNKKAQATCSVLMSDGSTNGNCGSFSSDNTATATVDPATGVVTAVAAGSANISATATGTTVTGSAKFTVTATPPPPPVTVTAVTLNGIPSTLIVGQTAQASCTVAKSDGSQDSQCSFASDNAAVASINATTGLITANAAGMAHFVATSTEDTSKVSPAATLTVTPAATRGTPTITSVTVTGLRWFSCITDCVAGRVSVAFFFKGTNFAVGDTIASNGWAPQTLIQKNVSADGASMALVEPITGNPNPDLPDQTPGYFTFTDQPTDGTPASNTVAIAYLSSANTANFGPNGEILQAFGGNLYVWSPSGNSWTSKKLAVSALQPPLQFSYVVVGGTGYYVSTCNLYNLDGSSAGGVCSSLSDPVNMTGSDAQSDGACFTQAASNYSATSVYVPSPANQQVAGASTGTSPNGCQVADVSGKPYTYSQSIDGTPTVWMVDANGNTVGSQPTGFTSYTTIFSEADAFGAVWIRAIKSGSDSGVFAAVSAFDQSMLIVDGRTTTMPVLARVSLAKTCAIPSALWAVDATNTFVVACSNPQGPGVPSSFTSFVRVDLAGNITSLKSTSSKFPQGFVADSNNLYVIQGSAAPDVVPNN